MFKSLRNNFHLLKHPHEHKKVWMLAGPMILSNISVPLLGLVDTAVMGHLEQAYFIGAVAIGSMIFGIVFWGFGFLRMGTTGITAQTHGAGDVEEVRATLGRAIFLAIIFSFVLILIQQPLAWLAFKLIQGSAVVEQHARVYFDIRILSAPATFANYALIGWFLGMQNARSPFKIILLVNIVNIVLDVIFVAYLQWEVSGVAWASLIAEYFGLCMGLYWVTVELKKYPGSWPTQFLYDKQKMRDMLALNKNIFIRTLSLMFTLAFFTSQGSKFGDVILAANAVLFNFQTLMAYGLDGFAHASEALVGRAIGAKNRADFKAAVLVAATWAILVALLFSAFYALAGKWIINILTDIAQVRSTAYAYMPWVILLPLVSVWGFMLDGIYIGAMRAREMRNVMLIATFLCFLPVWYVLKPLGNHGLWLAFSIFMLSRGIGMGYLFVRLDRRQAFM